MTVFVTKHAIERYQERVDNVPDEVARAALSAPAIEAADAFGAKYVRLGGGQLVVLEDHKVVTVLPRKTWRGTLDARRSPVARAPRPPRIQELLDD